MAVLLDASNEVVSLGTRALPTTTGSIAFWHWPNWTAASDGAERSLFQSYVLNNQFSWYKWSDNKLYVGWFTASTDYRVIVNSGSYTLNANAWNHWCFTWNDTTNSSLLYLNGTQIGSNSSLVTHTTSGNKRLGNSTDDANRNADSKFAEFAIWSRVLATGEITSLSLGVSPLLFDPDEGYWPLVRDMTDVELGNTATLTNGTVTDHCRIIYPKRTRTMFVPDAGGGGGATVSQLCLLGVG